MKQNFNARVAGVSPEQTRVALMNATPPEKGKSMVEQEQLYPELKPQGMGEHIVEKQAYQDRLNREHHRLRQYQIKVTEIHSRFYREGKLVGEYTERDVTPLSNKRSITNDFNMEAAQAHDMKEIGLSH